MTSTLERPSVARGTRDGLAMEIVLGALAVLGVLALVWLLCSWAFGLTIVVFKTGSMSPTMPAGAAAVSQTVPAAAVAVGDVVTVQREPGRLPVAHRVVSVSPVDGRPEARSLVLRGDANLSPDADPYVVEEAPRVLVAAPGAGLVLAALLLTMLVAGLVLVSGRAVALIRVPEAQPGRISLWTTALPVTVPDLAVGQEAYVPVDVRLDDADEAALTLEVRKSGDLATMPGGLELDVTRCPVAWTAVPSGPGTGVAPVCAGAVEVLLNATPADDLSVASPTFDLGDIVRGANVHLMLRVGIPAPTDPALVDGRTASFGLGLFAAGDGPAAAPAPALAVSGADVLALLLIGVGAVGLGVLVRAARALPEPVAAGERT